MKVYIAGKITGEQNYQATFAAAATELEAQGHKALNPAILPEGFAYEEYMHICFAMIDVCDEVVFLPCWSSSNGARREHQYALAKSKRISWAGPHEMS